MRAKFASTNLGKNNNFIDSMFQPKISVVIPLYNHDQYIVEALDSVLNQTFDDLELIVIDDGSVDDSWNVLQSYAIARSDPRLRIERQENGGSHAAINHGIQLARSDWIAILNSDDRYEPTRLARFMEVVNGLPGIALVLSTIRLIDERGMEIDAGHWWLRMYNDLVQCFLAQQAEKGCQKPAVAALLWGNFAVSTSNFFFSRALVDAIGPFKSYRYVQDWEFALRAAEFLGRENFIFLDDEALLDYRLHGKNTILTGALANHAEAMAMLRIFIRRWLDDGNPLSAKAINRMYYLGRYIRQEKKRQVELAWFDQYEQLRSAFEQNKVELDALRNQLQLITQSRSWRWTSHIRNIKDFLSARSLRRLKRILKKTLVREKSPYYIWLRHEDKWMEGVKQEFLRFVASNCLKTEICVVMPVHNPDPVYFKAALESIGNQWYPHWRLSICDDASTDSRVIDLMREFAGRDSRVTITTRMESGHIVCATNDALAQASSDFVFFMDHDDCIPPHALFQFARAIAENPKVDLFYADEDKLDLQGNRTLPLFKPGFSPALLWSQNYIGHPVCLRRSMLQGVGNLRLGTQGAQDHDLMLRLHQAGAHFAHIPQILYHWRQHEESTASNASAKPYAQRAGIDALIQYLRNRYGDQFDRLETSEHSFLYYPRFKLPKELLVSVIIPTRDKVELLRACIQSIRQNTAGLRLEIIVVDNGSTDSETLEYLAQFHLERDSQVIRADIPFNWSRLNNIGRCQAKGGVLVFLNNDTIVEQPDWLVRMVEYALLPDVGLVGPLLKYEDGTIQHAGVVVGMGGWADHVFKGELPVHFPSPFISALTPRNVLALTGACHVISSQTFDDLGGYDESFLICGSDVAICLAAYRQGLQNVYLPTVSFYHLESKSRSPEVPKNDFVRSAEVYHPYRTDLGDPFFNPNLDLFSPVPRCLWPLNANVPSLGVRLGVSD